MTSSTHFCCLDCRINIKKECWRQHNWTGQCPRCKKLMHNMGKKFRPPRKGHKSQWKKVKLLVENNIKFGSCYGACCKEKMPSTVAEAKEFIKIKRR